MKIAAFIALSALSLAALPVSYSYANDGAEEQVLSLEDAKELINSEPEAKDATKGTVPDTNLTRYYDIRARQLAYRENVKDYRASLERRRVSYSKPQFEAAQNYRDTIAKVYIAEIEAAAKARAEGSESYDDHDNKTRDYSTEEPAIIDADLAANGEDSSQDAPGLTEKPIPADPDAEEGAPQKKVVTSKDAPDFDPSEL